jgi:hypothetical protein
MNRSVRGCDAPSQQSEGDASPPVAQIFLAAGCGDMLSPLRAGIGTLTRHSPD